MERVGYEVIAATHGKEGLRQYWKHRPALVMTDILRSDKKGLETIQQFRQKGSDTEIIGTSGGGSECGS